MNINNLINEIKSNYNNDELAQIINELKLLLVKQESIVETECKCPPPACHIQHRLSASCKSCWSPHRDGIR